MNEQEVFAKVIGAAYRFGSRNPQQLKLLASQLSKCDAEIVVAGLLRVFFDQASGTFRMERQELAGALLEALNPVCQIDLVATIRGIAPSYELSVEQLPEYLAKLHGRGSVISAIDGLLKEENNEKTKRALETMRWWVKGSAVPTDVQQC